MDIIKALLKELDQEFNTTKKFLALVPADKMDWAPHEKSMKMGPLAIHLAELPAWIELALTTDELDFATMDWTPTEANGPQDLLNLLEKSNNQGSKALASADIKRFEEPWILRSADVIHGTFTRYEMMRVALAQTIHHRAQLGVFLRLLNIPLPGSYGPTADDNSF